MHIPILWQVSHFVMARGVFSPSMLGIMAATTTTSVRRGQGREHADEVARLLAEAYPDARCELDHDGPYQLGENPTHLAFRTDDIALAKARHQEMGCFHHELPAFGVYFIADPDGCLSEIMPTR